MRWLSVVLLLLLLTSTLPSIKADNPMATPEPTQAPTVAGYPASPILTLSGVTFPVHDPTLIKDGTMYYIFSTGAGIPIHCSPDILNWTNCDKVFHILPEWVYKAIPGVTDLWAPDIVFWDGEYHLYYAASTFGSNHSAIGLATNVTLDQFSPNYKWVDQGEVIASQSTDDFNTIDPNLVTDVDGQRWLVFGSFWTGIKMRKIDSVTGKLATEDTTLYGLASRPGITAIEGAFITHRNDYYYLFVSFDFCCKGVDSTYKIMVGRSKEITGPFVDRDGKPLINGGGSLVDAGSDNWRGPGHNSIYIENGIYWMVYHAYNAEINGTPTLRIEALQWDASDWPVSPSAIASGNP